ncbi:carboxylesterase family protein [Antiquaquibacter oligotrophicus]|nr:carboxylesterase family protein [Antiquaquibacter oligotrophicus]UDF12653.1 carboxylesterase family protein [Antiquaquibacter oligotrophicus]
MTEVIVECPAGRIVGLSDGVVDRFLGIPYAEAPIGPSRWRGAQRRPPFTDAFAATSWGATAQRGQPYESTFIPEPSVDGEETLNLNVFSPAHAGGADSRLPVLVWVHGGGYVSGSAIGPWYDGSPSASRGALVVTIGYRLGWEGFGKATSGINRGVSDWIAALEWVQDNIADFGGDPSRVTIAGQSAGGGAVLTLLSSPRAVGLFQQAAAFSPVDVCLSLDDATRVTTTLAERAGVDTSELERMSSLQLQGASVDLAETGSTASLRPFAPVYGDDLVPEPIMDALGRHGLDKPLLIGATAHELSPPDLVDGSTTRHKLSSELFHGTVRRTVDARRRSTAPTWVYRFDWRSPVTATASHCLDVPFFLGTAPNAEDALGPDYPRDLVSTMNGDLLRFVHAEGLPWSAARSAEDEPRVYGSGPAHEEKER